MGRIAQRAERLGERERYSNRARFEEEVSHGLFSLMKARGRNKSAITGYSPPNALRMGSGPNQLLRRPLRRSLGRKN